MCSPRRWISMGFEDAAARHGVEGEIRVLAVDTPVPSQFSHEILNANPYAFLDDAPLEERRARAVEMRRMLPESVLEEVGGLDPAAIAQVREEAWPDVRDADELHDVLHTLVALPEDLEGCGDSRPRLSSRAKARLGFPRQHHFSPGRLSPSDQTVGAADLTWTVSGRVGWIFRARVDEGRSGTASVRCRRYWVAAERAGFAALFPRLNLCRLWLMSRRRSFLATMLCSRWLRDGCRIWGRLRLRRWARSLGLPAG
jgi:hypothetical protein